MHPYTWLLLTSMFSSPSFASQAESTLTANETEKLPAVRLKPTIVYQRDQLAVYPEPSSTTDGQESSTSEESNDILYAVDAIASQNVSLAYSIPLGFELEDFTGIDCLCWYPVSGYYGLLSRVLFYATMLFAVCARRHQWLIVGALAASMTYAGTAAIHACIIMWSNNGLGNNDVLAILGMLVFACAMVVPLLTWSKTIKDIGKSREEDSIGRSIIITWACLIFIGFITIFVGSLVGRLRSSHGDESFLVTNIASSASQSVTCTPPNGILDLTAGQNHNWTLVYITQEFIEHNRCSNPCSQLRFSTLLKDVADLQPLTKRDINNWRELASDIRRQERTLSIVIALIFGGLAMCWAILQSLTIILFGRRSPIQVRNKTYLSFFHLFKRRDLPGKELSIANHYLPHLLAKAIAYAFYFWCVATTVVSIAMIVGSIIITEFIMAAVPQSDQTYEVDQWSAWVVTGLILVTALLYRYEGIFEDCLMRTLNALLRVIHRCFHGDRKVPREKQPLEKEILVSGKRTASVQRSNRSIVGHLFADSIRHYRDRFTSMPNNVSISWQDSVDFWKDSLRTAERDDGQAHNRRRKVVNFEGQGFPSQWKADGLDDWLTLQDFIQACEKYDERRRVDPSNKDGKGYKWQPRVILDDGIVDALRTQFDGELFKDIFTRSTQSGPDSESHSYVAVNGSGHVADLNNGNETDSDSDEESDPALGAATPINPSAAINDHSISSQQTQEQPVSTTVTTTGVIDIPEQHLDAIRPINRRATAGTSIQLPSTHNSSTELSQTSANSNVRRAATFSVPDNAANRTESESTSADYTVVGESTNSRP